MTVLNRLRERDENDGGFTLLEVVVGMTIMCIFLAIFGGSIISMFHSVDDTTHASYAQSNVNQLYLNLDRQIRYASGISQPASNVFQTGDAVVEFATSWTGTPTCTQLRLSPTGLLQERTWGQNDSPVVPSAPRLLATDLQADTPSTPAGPSTLVAGPFATLQAVDTASNQRLEIAFNAKDNRAVNTSNKVQHVDVTFTALDTGTSTSSNSICSQGRSIPWPSP
jgi:prepilin-type N-terminal cleavage/methylation domain-containing protein